MITPISPFIRHPGESRDPLLLVKIPSIVLRMERWVPAFAGMTEQGKPKATTQMPYKLPGAKLDEASVAGPVSWKNSTKSKREQGHGCAPTGFCLYRGCGGDSARQGD